MMNSIFSWKRNLMVLLLCLGVGACNDNTSSKPQPKPNPSGEDKKGDTGPVAQPAPPTTPGDSKTVEENPSTKETEQGENRPPVTAAPTPQAPDAKAPPGVVPKIPIPVAPVPSAPSIPGIIQASDDVTLLLSRLFVENHPDTIDGVREKLVDEVFTDENEAPAKIVELQAAIGKIAQHGLYSPEVKSRVAYLQSRLMDRIQQNQYDNVLQKGLFIVGTGAVLGALAGTGAYRHLPEISNSVASSLGTARVAVREKASEIYSRAREAVDEINAAIRDRERRNQLVDRTRASFRQASRQTAESVRQVREAAAEAGQRLRGQVSAVTQTRSADQLILESLDDFGVAPIEKAAIRDLSLVQLDEFPVGLRFEQSPKATLEYAVLDFWKGEELGLERMLAFRQKRLVGSASLDSIYVTNPIPADTAGKIVHHLRNFTAAPVERQFVHYVNLKDGVVTALRWPVEKFNNMITVARREIRPLFINFDTPTALGTTALSTAGMGILYYYGYKNGSAAATQYGAVDLEQMVRPQPESKGEAVSALEDR